ncbi:transposase [Nostoc minutum NIES-26]|uniref:Transposase n=1 Tax=Nostoc minutum NIES-26 TaxID=1844469 RepID=A0A367Q3I1_9NOSO|nr:transposase [Nostoc minutum NIES-26]
MNIVQSTETYFQKLGVRENFRDLHLGMISEIKRKTLPEIAKVVGLENQQFINHFLTESPWSVESLKKRRLELIRRVLNERSLILIIDETGDPKQGRTTDYVKRQYIGNLGKIENGIVLVTAYGVIEDMTFPLTFQIYKPRERLKAGEKYKTLTRNCSRINQRTPRNRI